LTTNISQPLKALVSRSLLTDLSAFVFINTFP
jgi:hypothetical protein